MDEAHVSRAVVLSTAYSLANHFGDSDVDVDSPYHLAQLKRVFRAANHHRMAVAVHAHANVNFNRPCGSREARIFLEQLLPAPPISRWCWRTWRAQAVSMSPAQQAYAVDADALARHDPRVRNLYFDACISATAAEAPPLAQRIREIGIPRICCGSDAPVKDNLPARQAMSAAGVRDPKSGRRTRYLSTGRSTRSNSAACLVKPRSVGCEPSTVPSPSSPSRLAPSR